MPIQRYHFGSPIFFLFLLLLPLTPFTAFGYGLMGPIAAAFGNNGFFCAIDASGEQEIICWDKNNKSTTSSSSSSSSTPYLGSPPPMASLSGGEGFMCGITSNASKAYCWSTVSSGTGLVPPSFEDIFYSQIAAGKDHVCAIRGDYFSRTDLGPVDCWQFGQPMSNSSNNMTFVDNFLFHDPSIDGFAFRKIVSGEGFTCGVVKEGGVICWGPQSANMGFSSISGNFKTLVSSRNSVCGISSVSWEVECWGKADEFGGIPPNGTRFVGLSAGAQHYCGIREDDHIVDCWGIYNASLVPKGSGFMSIASSDHTTCGIREVDLVLDCWGVHGQSPPDYSPPLQLCSPGVCSPGSCSSGKFAFNASVLDEPGLTSLCHRHDLKICLPCGTKCSQGYFLSSPCSENADRTCTACSLCQNSSCLVVCGISSSFSRIPEKKQQEMIRKLIIIIGSTLLVSLLVLIGWYILPWMIKTKDEEGDQHHFKFCAGKPVVEADTEISLQTSLSASEFVRTIQVFRLSELKDATHGFKEYNELGRGNFGFVYKAVLSDGYQVAVKRANAATIIHTNIREFEVELEILCNIRHSNVVNLLGYCAEMGERLLVFEFMPHGTLHDHLHGELSPLDWNLRLKISLQAAKGLEYLHEVVKPPMIHKDVKTSNILLDSEWGARISDFGLMSASDKDLDGDMEGDVYNFGIVLLEILSGRKAYDRDCTPSGIVEWALPVIRQGKAAAIIDRNVALPRNVEPLLKLADIAELALREDHSMRPNMSEIVCLLDQNMKGGLTM
ncbi:serine/threonine-protein kinase-like protein CCR2 [Ziziphus jujuba]|uniref:non-specific serine/threonine protein kinase n=1 Tax=Ziziphus jujuba TaxID=326968 RepID=A0A6P3ZDU8_ZIZJJ|nr:serine/threonine-protein kinase-like protein CCR2 [Ziziphus jujuba]